MTTKENTVTRCRRAKLVEVNKLTNPSKFLEPSLIELFIDVDIKV